MSKIDDMKAACLEARAPMTGSQLKWVRKHLLVLNINELAEQQGVFRGAVRRWEMADEVKPVVANAMRYLIISELGSDERVAERIEGKAETLQDVKELPHG